MVMPEEALLEETGAVIALEAEGPGGVKYTIAISQYFAL